MPEKYYTYTATPTLKAFDPPKRKKKSGGDIMKDNDIIKALECCKERDINCVSSPQCGVCPLLSYFHTVADREDCRTLLFAKALGLINRQKAEIERLQAEAQNGKALFLYYF